jgi:hypothetical protein
MAIFYKTSPGDGYCRRGQEIRQFCYRLRTEPHAFGRARSMREMPGSRQPQHRCARPRVHISLRKRIGALCHPHKCACAGQDG